RGVWRLDHVTDVAEGHDCAAVLTHDTLGKLRGGERLALAAQRDALIFVFNESSAAHARGAARRRDHLVQRKIVSDQSIRSHLDLKLLHLAAEDSNLRHAADREKPWLDG